MPPEDQAKLVWGPENVDSTTTGSTSTSRGSQRWVLPELDETYAARPKQVYSYHDLLELFDTTTKLHATRPALRMERGGREETYSYADLQELATRVGVFLVGARRRRQRAGDAVREERPRVVDGVLRYRSRPARRRCRSGTSRRSPSW